jgi:hypothetical protein
MVLTHKGIQLMPANSCKRHGVHQLVTDAQHQDQVHRHMGYIKTR